MMNVTLDTANISTKLERIANLAKTEKRPLLTLAHHIDINWLREAYRRTRKDGAKGTDGQSAQAYAANLESNLGSLLERAKSGAYRAPPVKRVYIPKGNGEQRPLGLPSFEDKVLQRAVTMVLEAVYEQEFCDCSYGFRPGRSAHQAIEAFRTPAILMAGGWVIELDIRKYFDAIPHDKLRETIRQRVGDGVILRLIGKWLNAGVIEDGAWRSSESGSPQGGVISPMLSNIYLHEVLDQWFVKDVLPCLNGRAHLSRFADDGVMLFEYEEDAKRVMAVLSKRFEKYGLTLHPEKTRLIPFKRPDRTPPRRDDDGPNGPSTFDFLGFTIHWAKSQQGKWVVKTRTASDRFRRGLKSISKHCRENRHDKVEVQQKDLNAKLRGHYGYYGRRGNRSRLWDFLHEVTHVWKRWLSRRSQRGLTWKAMTRLLERYPLLTPSQVQYA